MHSTRYRNFGLRTKALAVCILVITKPERIGQKAVLPAPLARIGFWRKIGQRSAAKEFAISMIGERKKEI